MLEKPDAKIADASARRPSHVNNFDIGDKTHHQTTGSTHPVATSYTEGKWSQTPENLLLESNDYVNDSARLYNPFGENTVPEDGGTPLYKSLRGRLLTQSVARGLFGAAFFAAGSYMVEKYQPGEAIMDQTPLARPLAVMEKFLDSTLTKGATELVVKPAYYINAKLNDGDVSQVADLANEFMRFNKYAPVRHLAEHALNNPEEAIKNLDVYGNTWGQEMVQRTWSFASGSIGSSLGRNFVALVDPNHKVSWVNEGKVDFGEMVTSSAKQLWQIMAYNQMEDWFAGMFYTWQIRAQRGAYSNGFINRTEGENSAMPNLQTEGLSTQRRVSIEEKNGEFLATLGDSYAGANALDYQTRFMGYNFYTLVFRDLYNHLFRNHDDNDCYAKEEAPKNPVQSFGYGASETAKYLVKSFTKSMIYMAPSVMAFWPMRVGSSLNNHYLVDEQSGNLITTRPRAEGFEPIRMKDEQFVRTFNNGTALTDLDKIHISKQGSAAGAYEINEHLKGNQDLYLNDKKIRLDHGGKDSYAPFDDGNSAFDKGLGLLGKTNYHVTNALDKGFFQPSGKALHYVKQNILGLDTNQSDTLADASMVAKSFTGAAMSYTPYMIAKYEFANLWDTPVMDAAAYRMADGLFDLKPKEFFAGIKDVASVVAFQKVSDKTLANVGERRGLINSRYEAQCRKETKQEEIRHERQIEKLGERIDAHADHPMPDTNVTSMTHADRTKLDGSHIIRNENSINTIQAFNPKERPAKNSWAEHTNNQAEGTKEMATLNGATLA